MIPRRGISLVEMMVAIVLMGMVGALTLQLLLSLFQANHRQQARSAADLALRQLQITLRDDAHAAQRAEVDADRLTLTMPSGERIVYTASTRAISKERIGVSAEQVVARERYALPRGLSLNWRSETATDAAWLFVELRPDESPTAAKAPPTPRGYADVRIRVGRGAGGEGDQP